MLLVKSFIYILIFCSCTYIGTLISRQYSNRVRELKELKLILNTIKTKIRYTNEPLKNIFSEISKTSSKNVSNLFTNINKNLESVQMQQAWESAIDSENMYINKSDKNTIKALGKMLGKTDLEGQISEIELTENFLETQIIDAQKEKEKNQKLYKTLGVVTGVGIIIILI